MAGEGSRYLLEIDIDWSQGKQSTDEFIAGVHARIAELEALAGKTAAQGGLNPQAVGEELGVIGTALRRIQTLATEAGAAMNPGIAAAALKVADLEAGMLRVAKAFQFTGYGGVNQQAVAAAKIDTAYTAAVTATPTGITPAAAERNAEMLAILSDQVTAAKESLAFQQFFAQNLRQQGGLAQELLAVDAKGIILSQERNAALQQAVGAEKLRQYVALSPTQREDRPEAAAARISNAQRRAAAAVEAQALIEEEVALALAEGKASRKASVNNQISAAQRVATASIEAEIAVTTEVELAEAEGKAARTASINATIANAQRRAAAAYEAQALIEEEVAAEEAAGRASRARSRNVQIASAQRVAAASVEAEFAILEQQRSGIFAGGASSSGRSGRGAGPGFLGGLSGGEDADFGQFAGSRLRSSAAFFLSGVAIFAVVDQLRNAVKASGELEKEFGVIQTMLAQFGQNDQFEKIRSQVLDLSVTTATASGEVAKVERQLAGVFANQQTGAPDFARAAIETDAATKFARVTGEKFTEIVDDFSAISVSFSNDQAIVSGGFKQIANDALALGQQLGVPDAAILKFASDIAPLAASLGFTALQLEGLGAVAIQASGRSASGLAEQIGRALSGLQDKFPQLIELFGKAPGTQGVIADLGTAFGSGNIPDVLKILVENYKQLNEAQIQNLALIVGGRREAGSFYALLQRGTLTLKALNEEFAKPEGDLLNDRFKKVTETITFQFDQAKIAVQRFLIELLDSGFGDALTTIAGGLTVVAQALAFLIGLVSPFFGNWVGQIIGVTAEILLLVKAFETLQKVVLATKIGAALFPGAAAAGPAAASAGFFGGFRDRFAAGGLLGGLATPLTAAAAGAFALNQLKGAIDQQNEVSAAGQGVKDAAIAELAKGTSLAEIRRRATDAGGSFSLSRGGLQSPAADLYNFASGQKDTQSLITDAQQESENLRKVSQLQALRDKRGDIQVPGIGGRRKLSELITKLSDNPGADDLNTVADFIIASSQGDPDVQRAMADAAAHAAALNANLQSKAAEVQAVSDRIADPTAARALTDLQKDFDKGNAGPAALTTVLQSRISDLTIGIAAAEAAAAAQGSTADSLAGIQKLRDEKDKLEKNLSDVIKKSVLGPLEFARKLREALGGTAGSTDADLQRTLSEITTAAAELDKTGNLDASTEQGFVIDALNALKERRKAEADKATTALGKDAINSRSIEVPVEIQKLSYDAQLKGGPAADFVLEFQNKLNIGPENARRLLVDELVKFGGDIGKVEAAVKQAELDYSRKALAAAADMERKLPPAFKKGILGALSGSVLTAAIGRATGITSDEIKTFATAIGTDAATAEQAIVSMFDRFGGNVVAIRNEMQQAELRVARTSLTTAIQLYNQFKDIPFLGGSFRGLLFKAYADYKAIMGAIAKNNAGGIGEAIGSGLTGGSKLGGIIAPPVIGPDPGAATATANDARAEAQALDNANLNIAAARANGDALKLAQIAKERAAISAKYAVLPSEKANALAEMINADNEIIKANQQYNDALRDLTAAQSGDDPVTVAKNAVDAANEAAANAAGPIAAANAQAAQIRAKKAWVSAIQDLADGQTNILIAMAEAAGDSVGAAQLKLKELTDRLANTGSTLNQGDKDKLTAEIISQSAAVVRTIISEGESQIQTDLTLKRITKAQAIAELEALRAKAISAHASQKEIDQISIEIQNLKGQLGQDFKFNLPSILGLPTLYEVQRTRQSGSSGGGYQDNRIVTVNVYAQTNANPTDIAGAVAAVVGPPNQFSTYSNKY